MAAETEKEVVRVIYHENVAQFFESLGLSEKLARGEIRCAVCDQVVTLQNFRAVTKKSGILLFCCDNEACIGGLAASEEGDRR